MLKMTYGFLFNTRVCYRSSIFSQIKEISSSASLESNLQKSNINIQNDEVLDTSTNDQPQYKNIRSRSRIVSAAFASLNDSNKFEVDINTPHTDSKISNASTVDDLLSISKGEGVSRRIALKIVSVLADWTTSKKIKLADFENDLRFIKLCKVLTRTYKSERFAASKSEDLSTVLSVTADEEAAKLIQTVTLPQMVKIMKTLANKKRRSTLLLRTLAYNISGNSDKLDLKHCSDLLFSMASLNFIDENLLSKVTLDVCSEIENEPETNKSAVIGSILTSLGLLKYKNTIVLDVLSKWLVKNCDICRSQDVFTLFITLATLNYMPPDSDKLLNTFSPYLTELEAGNPNIWLDHIWSKVILDIATPEEISYILREHFLQSLLTSNKGNSMSTNLKILNINGAADCLIDGYNKNKLPESSPFRNVQLQRRKEKVEIIDSVCTSLKNLMNIEKYLKLNTDTGYGFTIDAECIFDEKFSPKEFDKEFMGGTRIAIMTLDYHDMTKGRSEPIGINVFAKRILEAKGYKVLHIPYNEFNPQRKLISRVQYLEKNLKELVMNTT
ncbi:FAST kinase domain-containing protein 4 [Harmonia axyridis]|uniref:FAST kinase domain-containing protein 4 n=1 Tax=Harmonia axyridis TaxID=115357 RepID=UPI001E274F01|nr:FAST kinase domain-containing protein 4 [Harmonia axyridis]